MQLTRQQIIEYLPTNRVATSIEMSRALQVTAANIRHHLQILKSAGLVEEVGSETGRSRGRPTLLYSLTENALKHNLDGLSSALLKALLANSPNISESLNRIAVELSGDFQLAANMHPRLNQAVERLNELQYQAAWEASPNGPRLIFRNCPYALILNEHPELCHLDAELLAVLLERPYRQTVKLERLPEGAPHCSFIAR